VPEFATASAAGRWLIEGHGVDPDIVVENEPAAVIGGKDPRLKRGVAEIAKELKANPKVLPKHPPDPVKAPRHP
jgi:tricorn protease